MIQNGLPEIIRRALSGKTPLQIDIQSHRHASVLIPLLDEKGGYKILFTKRTTTVEAHKGQISFPGGRMDDTDCSIEETALREAEEEIGLRREDVDLLGRMDDAVTLTSNFIVHPFVGLIPYPYDFKTSPEEVDRILLVPFRAFLPDGVADRVRTIHYESRAVESLAYQWENEVIWGATARIMKNLVQTLGGSLDGLKI